MNLLRLFITLTAIVFLFSCDICSADVISIEGTLKSVDAEKRTLTLQSGVKTRDFDASSKAKVLINGKAKELENLMEGQKVTVSFHDQLEVVVSVEIVGGGTVKPTSPQADNDKESDEVILFDGRSLEHWVSADGGEITGWDVKNELIVSNPGEDVPYLVTKEKFKDFEFECEFMLGPKANGGVYLRGRYEVQLLDDKSFPKSKPVGKCGSIWGQIAPTKSAYQGPNKWNELKVKLRDKNVTITLNGTKIIDDKQIRKPTGGAIDENVEEPGPIALQSQSSDVRFRNLKIRTISE